MTIIFYEPKSFSASFMGVILQMLLVVMPIGMAILIFPSSYFGVFIGIVLGMFLMFKSENIINPIIGNKNVITFEQEAVSIESPTGKKRFLLTEFKSITAFSMEMESGSVKQKVLEWQDGRKLDIFDTWVMSSTSKPFLDVYKRYEQV